MDGNENPIAQEDAATTPIDLAQAFKMLNEADRAAAESNVDDGAATEPAGEEQPEQGEDTVSAVADGQLQGTDGSDGGYANNIDAIDFDAFRQNALKEIQQRAIADVRKEFDDQNIGYYYATELTVRDERTGQIRFRNPDVSDPNDPNYYFKSRTEMQQFCDSWNRGIDSEFRKAVNAKQQELIQEEAPKVRLASFIPKWNSMDQLSRNVLDELLEGHEIRNNAGQVIGFNVDLDSYGARAVKIAKTFGAQAPAQQAPEVAQQSVSSGPALDIKTGNGKSNDPVEPKTIGEALKMVDAQNKGGK